MPGYPSSGTSPTHALLPQYIHKVRPRSSKILPPCVRLRIRPQQKRKYIALIHRRMPHIPCHRPRSPSCRCKKTIIRLKKGSKNSFNGF